MLLLAKFLNLIVHIVMSPVVLLYKVFGIDNTNTTSHKYCDYSDHLGDN